jgi:hypothetical protein
MLEIFVAAKPVYLRGSVSINNIAFIILEIPGNNDKDIAFTNPNPFLDFTLDPPKARYAV